MPNDDPASTSRLGATILAVLVGGALVLLARAPAPAAAGGGTREPEAGATGVEDARDGGDGGALGRRERSGAGCQPIELTTGASAEDDVTVRWFDARCRPRSAVFVSPEKRDERGEPFGGGYVRELSYESDESDGGAGATVHAVGTGVNGWRGFGYVVAHFPTAGGGYDAAETIFAPGVHGFPLRGPHHLVYRASWRLVPGGPVDVTVEWLFATGRDAPLFRITYDARPAGPGAVRADSRAPYGDLAFEGDPDGEIGGVAWGDRYRFTTLDEDGARGAGGQAALSETSRWDYRAPNVVPFDRIWSRSRDAEMGLVATARWSDKPQGGDYGPGALQPLWGTSGRGLPTDWAWPYQIDQYDLPWSTSSHRLAWGMTFGAVGQPAYEAFDRVLSGYPFQSYSVHVVLGPHRASAVMAEVEETEATLAAEVRATRGRVASEAPGGIARTDLVTLAQPGWDPTSAAWTFEADVSGGGVVGGHFHVPSSALASPMLHVSGWNKPAVKKVTVNRQVLPASDVLATVDPSSHVLWLTLPTMLRGDVDFVVE